MGTPKASTMRPILILLAALAIHPCAMAQDRGYQGDLGGTIGLGLPVGEFADTWGQEMFTFGARLALPSRRLPFQLGFVFGHGQMGREQATVPVDLPDLAATEGRLKVKTKVLNYHPMLRFSPSKGKVRPYVEGLAGLRQFTTQSKVTVEGLDKPLINVRHENDFVLSTGWAAGLMVGLGGTGYLEARVERLYSGTTKYVDPMSITAGPAGEVVFNTLESPTGTLSVLLGLGLRF